MDTIFMNSKNSETSDPHKLLLNLTGKINLKKSDKYIALSNFSVYYTWKNIRKSYKNNKFKISTPTWNGTFELPDGLILYQIFKIIFNKSWKKNVEKTYNPLIRIYINKIRNRITFKISTEYYLKLLIFKMMKLLGNIKDKITKDEDG